ncbi:Uncharacterized protein YcgL [hydrothermal vent metagenome]|uniref:Uncharacterized protein YcgL n=1 Tax=hydrothermal vent metagenome TaxID=652676 RepID=A0A3B0Y616_9ZZZZ
MYIDVNKPIDSSLRQEIDRRLNLIEETYSVKIIYACESGSRSWGFSSPDSDYDIRFLYVRPKEWYLSIFEERDVIEPGIEEDNVVYDPSGWDIKKAFGLMRGCNGTLIEWLNAPIVYRSSEAINHIIDLQHDVYLPRNAVYHYTAMARRLLKDIAEKEETNLKRYFYILRATLCALFITEKKEAPPVLFHELFNQYLSGKDIGDHVERLLELKSERNEKEGIDRQSELEDYIHATLTHINATLPETVDKADKHCFDQAFIKTLEEVQQTQ